MNLLLRLNVKLHGYALAIHGTVDRDLDLVAIPWVDDEVSSPKALVDAFCGTLEGTCTSFVGKPHGRVAYTIETGGGGYIDLSIMPVIE